MNILLTGASGQLGRELYPCLAGLGTVIGVNRETPGGGSNTIRQDLGDSEGLERLLARVRPDVIVNAAAYTDVDAAEEHPDMAYRVNEGLPAQPAAWAAANGAFLLHYSTDYVFSGAADRAYTEDDAPDPLNVYGASKLAGENSVRTSGCGHLVVRTSWVWSGHGRNFVLTMLRLAAERPSLNIVSDQTGCPTWARNLARASRQMLRKAAFEPGGKELSGLYHYCDGEAMSWFDFANRVFGAAKAVGLLQDLPVVTAVDSASFPQKAERPKFSVLDATRAEKVFGIERSGLDDSLKQCFEELMDASG